MRGAFSHSLQKINFSGVDFSTFSKFFQKLTKPGNENGQHLSLFIKFVLLLPKLAKMQPILNIVKKTKKHWYWVNAK